MPGTDAERVAFRRRLGRSLAAFRNAADLSQQEIADWLGIDVETVGRWERGGREPKSYELYRMMVRYGAEPDWLLEPTDSVTELDARVVALRRAASEAARAVVADEQARRDGGDTSPRRGKSRP